jgi:hypothetical protein
MNRFKLPQVCHCGARGSITFEPTPLSLGSERDPDPAIIRPKARSGLTTGVASSATIAATGSASAPFLASPIDG